MNRTPGWTSSEKPVKGKPGDDAGQNEHQAQYQAEYASHKLKTEYANLLREADEMRQGGLSRPDAYPETTEGNDNNAPSQGDIVPELYSSDPKLDLIPLTPPPPSTPGRRSPYPEQEVEPGTPRPPQRETSVEPYEVGIQEPLQPPHGISALRSPHRYYDEELEILRRDEELGYLLGGGDSDVASLGGRSAGTNRSVSDNFVSDGTISDGYDSDGAVTDAEYDSDETVVPTVLDTHEEQLPLDVETEVDNPPHLQSDTDRESLSPEMEIDAPTEHGHDEEQASTLVENPNGGLQIEQVQPQPPALTHTSPQSAAAAIIAAPAAPANPPAVPIVAATHERADPTAAELVVERWPVGMPFNNSTGRGPDGEPLPETPLTGAELAVIRTLIPAHVRTILERPDPGFTVTFQHDDGPPLTSGEVLTAINIFVEYYLGDIVFRGERRREMSRAALLKYIRNDPRIDGNVQLRQMSYQQWKHQTWDRLMGSKRPSLKRRAMLCLARHYYPKDRIAARRLITK
ncbi:uncharacterized protein DNG_02174 [Cephalotrichum gorgonifer]|uniref:Uncharacterized protein n=1 Tax=Cephalotrichum gorgonifer TaxID=2041049 RepID=A0AAE8MSV4_9PEZI|nr:uncharacterized protein DNG_02174 [Cephalotrichum gorgonifer]